MYVVFGPVLGYALLCAADISTDPQLVCACTDDQEVLKVEERQRKRAKVYKKITDWTKPSFPKLMKVNLLVGGFCMALFFSLTAVAGSMCFKDFQVMKSSR